MKPLLPSTLCCLLICGCAMVATREQTTGVPTHESPRVDLPHEENQTAEFVTVEYYCPDGSRETKTFEIMRGTLYCLELMMQVDASMLDSMPAHHHAVGRWEVFILGEVIYSGLIDCQEIRDKIIAEPNLEHLTLAVVPIRLPLLDVASNEEAGSKETIFEEP